MNKILTSIENSPHVREYKTVLSCGFHVVDSGSQLLDSGFFFNLYSGFQSPRFTLLQFRCPDSLTLCDFRDPIPESLDNLS